MRQGVLRSSRLIATCSLIVAACPLTAAAQTISGQARAAQVTTFSALGAPTTTVIADTGTLADTSDVRQTSQITASVPDVLSCGTVHAVTIGWPDEVASETSLSDLALTVAGNTIGADFVMSRAAATAGAAATGRVSIQGLAINGLPIAVTGAANQTVLIPGGRVVINEQQATTSNALHVVIDGVADVIVASATAGIQ
jgi:hypothetical protein